MTREEHDLADGRNRFSRRGFLAASSVATVGLAGCLGGGDDGEDDDGDEAPPDPGEEEDMPGPNPPVVEEPPDAVYKPTHRESVGMLDTVQAGDYMVLPHFTFPHQFWLMRGDDDEPVLTEPSEPGLHFMFAVWDAETGNMLPVDTGAEMTIRRDGNIVDQRIPWPMIDQSMGFHFGDNIPLPEQGTYEIEVQLNPISARKTGAFEGRFEETASTEFSFEFDREAQQQATEAVEFLPEEEWGEPGALELMSHSDHNDHDDHGDGMGHPEMALPAADSYPGIDLGVYSSGDADFVVRYLEDSRLAQDEDDYLFISPRTPYNRIPLPDLSLSVEGDVVGEPQQTLDGELGHHYGLATTLESGDSFDIVVDSPPQVSRHQGYETAFIEMPSMTVKYEE